MGACCHTDSQPQDDMPDRYNIEPKRMSLSIIQEIKIRQPILQAPVSSLVINCYTSELIPIRTSPSLSPITGKLERNVIHVIIKMLKGDKWNQTCTGNGSGYELKQCIAISKGYEVKQQRIIFDSQEIEDDKLLSHYAIKNGSTLYLVLRRVY